MLKHIVLILVFIIMSVSSSDARTWKQGAMRYIKYHNNCGVYGYPVIASYYGYENGRKTASGQTFRPYGISAAHRTARFGTRFRVTNPRNKRSVQVVINDRGPYVKGVTIDLSAGAARAIGMTGSQYVCLA